MSIPSYAHLETEIARLNQIIEALLLQNSILKAEIAHLETSEGTKIDFPSIPKLTKEQPQTILPTQIIGMEQK